MANIAIVEKSQSNISYEKYFDFPFQLFKLTDSKEKKILKKDITLDISLLDSFDYVILVGADACKHIGKISSVVKYQGHLVDEKWLPLTNPAMLAFKPEGQGAFDKAVRDISNIIGIGEVRRKSCKIYGIEDKEECLGLISEMLKSDVIALDSETSSLYPEDGYVLGISVTFMDNVGYYISSDCMDDEVISKFQKVWDNTKVVFHNAKFDMKFFEYHFGWHFSDWEDTLLLHYCLNEQPGTHGLKQLAMQYTDLGDYDNELETYKKEYCKQHKILQGDFTYDLIPFDIMYKYAGYDTIATFTLFAKFYPIVIGSKNLSKVYNTLLKPGTEFLNKMEQNGVPFDKGRLAAAKVELAQEISELEKQLYNFKEIHDFENFHKKKFNPNSVAHLREVLFTRCNVPVPTKRTATGNISVDAEVLESLEEYHELPKLISNIKKAKKIKSTYIDKIIPALNKDSRLRTGFNLYTTTSGRLSSSGKLNMQQLPRDNKIVKSCIKARDGYVIVSSDLATAEMYTAAAITKDPVLSNIFINKEDYHSKMAVLKFDLPYTWQEVKENHKDLRQAAKTVSFEILYKLNLNEPALKHFKVLKRWLMEQKEFIAQNGFAYQIFGRKRRVPNVASSDKQVVAHEIRSCINSLFQGPASDINLYAAIDMQNYIEANNMGAKIFALVHDSILAEVPIEELDEYKAKIKEFTQKDRGMMIPGCPIGIDVEVGYDYSFKEKL